MAKYKTEFKLEVVKSFLAGEGGAKLLCGSGNHLRAFNEQLLAQGVTYVPQVISQAEWDAIANTPQETCGG